MLDYVKLSTKDLGQEGLSPDSVRENARAKAVRASYEFWSTGKRSPPRASLRGDLCRARRAAAPRAGHEWIAAKHAPRGVGKGIEMIEDVVRRQDPRRADT
jgi:hypothetical protein